MQNIDITNFEEDESIQRGFAKNYDIASRQFMTAIDEIDKSIARIWKRPKKICGSQPINSVWRMTKRTTFPSKA